MNIFEMLSFDFKEFVTSPAGILIILGIICLLVGIVIFLKEGKKSAKATEAAETPAPVTTTEEVKTETPAPAPVVEAAPLEPVQEAAPVVVKATEDGVNEVPVPEVAETLNISEPAPAAVEVPQPETLNTTETINPVVEAPVQEAAPVVAAPEVAAPTVEAPAVESLDEAQPTVYGGASPEVANVGIEEKPREIYGGANPLENTAPVPTEEVKVAIDASPVVESPIPEVAAPAPEVATPAPAVAAPAPAVAAPAPEAPKEEIEKLEF